MYKSMPKIFALVVVSLISYTIVAAQAGSTRPRRVNPVSTTSQTEANTTANTSTATRNTSNTRTSNSSNATTTATTTSSDTARAYSLLQQKQYEAAVREAKQIAARNPNDSEAWKIAGFAEINLNQFAEAAADLQRALDLQRATNEEDPNTVNALAVAYMRIEKFDQALPLLMAITTRAGARPDPVMLNYRGFAEMRTGKLSNAEQSFNLAIKADPKNALALFYLGKLAYDSNRLDQSINALNRATLNDPRLAQAWLLLTTGYLRRAGAATDETKASGDYQNAVRAAEGLTRVKADADSLTLYGQALISAQKTVQAVPILERAAQQQDAKAVTFYWLGVAHSRLKNFAKAIAALERASEKNPDEVSTYRELGYAYEISRQYSKALAAYERGAALAPDDTDFKDSIARVRPLVK